MDQILIDGYNIDQHYIRLSFMIFAEGFYIEEIGVSSSMALYRGV
jgi:hypothetical protein